MPHKTTANKPKEIQPRTAVIRIDKTILNAIAKVGKPYGFSAQRTFNILISGMFTSEPEPVAKTLLINFVDEINRKQKES